MSRPFAKHAGLARRDNADLVERTFTVGTTPSLVGGVHLEIGLDSEKEEIVEIRKERIQRICPWIPLNVLWLDRPQAAPCLDRELNVSG